MKKYIILILVFVASNIITQAQQIQSSSFYELQTQMNNPSVAGIMTTNDVKAVAGILYRKQWSGISGSPTTATAFGSFSLPKLNVGIGAVAYNDKTGPTSKTGLNLAFAKHIKFNDGGIFSLGLEARLLQYGLDRGKLSNTLGSDAVLGTSDTRFKFDAGFGASYTNNSFQIGAAVSQLIQSKLGFYSGNVPTTEVGKLYRHYYFHGKYNWNVDGETTITPNALVTYLPNAPVELLTGVRVEHNKMFWWGLGYRLKQNVMLSAGFHLKKQFTIAYTYDVYNNPIGIFSGGSGAHEFMLRYNFIK
jgi:type IX secretion system PorP/SprF family membrane protein